MSTATTANTATDSDREGIEIDYEELSRRDPEQFYSGTRFEGSWRNNEEKLVPQCVSFISQVVQEVMNDGTAPERQTSFSLGDLEQGTSIGFSVEQTTYTYSEENSSLRKDAEWSDTQRSTGFPEIEPDQVQETTFPVVTAINEPKSPLVPSCRFSKRVNSTPPSAGPGKMPKSVLDEADLPPCNLGVALRKWPLTTTSKQRDLPVHLTPKMSKQVDPKPPNAGTRKVSEGVLDEVPPCTLGIALKKFPFYYCMYY